MWLRLPSNNLLHQYSSLDIAYDRRVMQSGDLDRLPDRRIFYRRNKTISYDIKSRIDVMVMFVREELVDPFIVSADSCILKKECVWHKSSMIKNIIPYTGIDIDARWGYGKTKGWIFGYKLYMTSSGGSSIVPLSAELTTANIRDDNIYQSITASIGRRN